MPVITAGDIADLVKGCLLDLGRMKFQQIAQSLQEYPVMSKWLKKDRVIIDDGRGIQRNIMDTTGSPGAHVGLFAEDTVTIIDHLKQMNIPWRHFTTAWGFERRELLMNRGKSQIVDLVKVRRAGSMIDMAQKMEDAAWSSPSSTDETLPYGVPYWVVKGSTAVDGFTANLPSGHTTVGGIDPATVTGWRNYAYDHNSTFTTASTGIIFKWRTATRKIGFVSPTTIDDYSNGKISNYRHYTNETVMSNLELLAESQNQNLGVDIDSMSKKVLWQGVPVMWVPKLDEDTSNPLYSINHSVFHPVVLKGDFMVESDAKPSPRQHNTFEVFVDLSYNYLCVDRRRCAVGAAV